MRGEKGGRSERSWRGGRRGRIEKIEGVLKRQEDGGLVQGEGRVLCHPICSEEEELEAVLEFVRIKGQAFTENDLEVINT